MAAQHQIFDRAAAEKIAVAVRNGEKIGRDVLRFRVDVEAPDKQALGEFAGLEDAISRAVKYLGDDDWTADVKITALGWDGSWRPFGTTLVSLKFEPKKGK